MSASLSKVPSPARQILALDLDRVSHMPRRPAGHAPGQWASAAQGLLADLGIPRSIRVRAGAGPWTGFHKLTVTMPIDRLEDPDKTRAVNTRLNYILMAGLDFGSYKVDTDVAWRPKSARRR